jgi:multicomponent Na+:H+ antiporter subunit D
LQFLPVITLLAAISIVLAGILSIGQKDIKRLMAYSSISQIGYIFLGLGLCVPIGIFGAIFHLFNHAFMKSLLFLTAGSVEQATGSRDMDELSGLRQRMPITSVTSLMGSLAISGVPPFNGFWSKFLIIIACAQSGHLWLGLCAVIGSILTLGAYLKMQKEVFFGPLPEKYAQVKESPVAMAFSMISLAVICLGIGLAFPFVMDKLINPAVSVVMQGTNYYPSLLKGGQ